MASPAGSPSSTKQGNTSAGSTGVGMPPEPCTGLPPVPTVSFPPELGPCPPSPLPPLPSASFGSIIELQLAAVAMKPMNDRAARVFFIGRFLARFRKYGDCHSYEC